MSEILVASGSLAVRMDLDETLAGGGFLFLTVSTAAQTISTLERGDVSMLILDPVLRDSDGMKLLRELRENPRYTNLPILLLCTEVDSERLGDSDIGWEHCEFLGKPYDKDHLLERAAQYAMRLDPGTGNPLVPYILVVDSNREYLGTLRDTIDSSRFALRTCSDRDEAREIMRSHQFDAVLLDIDQIDKNMRSIRRWIRLNGQNPTTAIIVLTHRDDRESMISVFSAGADDYVVKSDNIEGLVGRLRVQMRRKQAEHENRRMRESLLIKAMQTTEAERARRSAEARTALMTELEAKNAELERARRAAESAADAKSAFLASMSHEIRTPMNAILGMAELLDAEEADFEKRQRLDIIRSSGAHLISLIDQILDFSKIEAGKMEIDSGPVDIRACVEDALEIVAFQAAQKSIELSYRIEPDSPAGFIGDIGRIRQVLINFLSNAVKFTNEGEVSVRVSKEGDLESGELALRFSVRDTGIGIPADEMDDLFKSFSQLDYSSKRRYGGTGLGLAISQRLVDLMGGRVWCESEPRVGSTFHFSVHGRPAVIPPTPAERDTTMLQGRRVLVVDDSATARDMLGTQIRFWGAEAVTVSDAAAALRELRGDDPPDAAIIDLRLGGETDGIALGRAVREELALDIPMLLTSAISNSMDPAPEFAAFVAKPIRHASLHAALERALGGTAEATGHNGRDGAHAVGDDGDKRSLEHLCVLLVEDNAVNRRVAHLMLQRMGVDVVSAESGEEAVSIAADRRFDVILMDINMPDMDGIETAAAIREQIAPGEPAPRIIALTASALTEDRDRCLEAGMERFVSKPVSLEELRQALESVSGDAVS